MDLDKVQRALDRAETVLRWWAWGIVVWLVVGTVACLIRG